jgi:hypothetical protein
MAATLDTTKAKKKKVTRVTLPMLHQMLSYAEWCEKEGSYYGQEKHFRNRHRKIVAWLEAIRDNRIRKVSPTIDRAKNG